MEEKEIEVNGEKINIITRLPKEYVEDNSLKVFLDDTINLGEVISEIKNDKSDIDTNEMNNNE